MTEAEWQGDANPHAILAGFKEGLSDRKLRLFGCGCCRALNNARMLERFQQVINVAERYADGELGGGERKVAENWAKAHWREASLDYSEDGRMTELFSRFVLIALAYPGKVRGTVHASIPGYGKFCWLCGAVAREVFGSAFRLVSVAPAWLSPTVIPLTTAAYTERQLPSGHLDQNRLTVLSDALEEAGCADAEILGHLRDPGPHVRGCWALDLLLGKE